MEGSRYAGDENAGVRTLSFTSTIVISLCLSDHEEAELLQVDLYISEAQYLFIE